MLALKYTVVQNSSGSQQLDSTLISVNWRIWNIRNLIPAGLFHAHSIRFLKASQMNQRIKSDWYWLHADWYFKYQSFILRSMNWQWYWWLTPSIIPLVTSQGKNKKIKERIDNIELFLRVHLYLINRDYLSQGFPWLYTLEPLSVGSNFWISGFFIFHLLNEAHVQFLRPCAPLVKKWNFEESLRETKSAL